MVPIKLDFSDFFREWKLTTQEADLFIFNVMDEIGIRFADKWRDNAGKELKKTKQEYQRSIYIEKPDKYSVSIGLVGWLPNAIEKGLSPFDMKEGFSRSLKKKTSFRVNKNGGYEVGWYLTIPFRIGTPGIVGESSIFSTIMPKEVYKIALQELRNGSNSLSISQLPPEYQIRNIRPEITNNDTGQIFPLYQHQSALFEGLTRVQKEGQRGSHYMTFRRVSDLSSPSSWINPGIVAHNLLDKTLNNFPIADIVSNIKENFLENR